MIYNLKTPQIRLSRTSFKSKIRNAPPPGEIYSAAEFIFFEFVECVVQRRLQGHRPKFLVLGRPTGYRVHNMSGKLYKRLFVPDAHFPFHDPRAWRCMVNVAEAFKPDEVVYLGDFWDCYSVSDYTKNPEQNFQLLESELGSGREALAEIERKTKAKNFVFLEGNHENRIDRYVATYASKLGGIVNTREVLKIPKHYKYYPYGMKNHHVMGKLIATHGSLCGKHAACAMVSKYGHSVLFGHTHKIQEFQMRNASGQIFRGINIGWLGDIDRAAEYIKNIADWCHGFAIGYFKPNGDFFLQVIPIINYECVFNETLFTGYRKK